MVYWYVDGVVVNVRVEDIAYVHMSFVHRMQVDAPGSGVKLDVIKVGGGTLTKSSSLVLSSHIRNGTMMNVGKIEGDGWSGGGGFRVLSGQTLKLASNLPVNGNGSLRMDVEGTLDGGGGQWQVRQTDVLKVYGGGLVKFSNVSVDVGGVVEIMSAGSVSVNDTWTVAS